MGRRRRALLASGKLNRMGRCKRREPILTDEQYRTILIAIQDRAGAVVAEAEDCAIHEQLVKRGFLKFVREVPGYRR